MHAYCCHQGNNLYFRATLYLCLASSLECQSPSGWISLLGSTCLSPLSSVYDALVDLQNKKWTQTNVYTVIRVSYFYSLSHIVQICYTLNNSVFVCVWVQPCRYSRPVTSDDSFWHGVNSAHAPELSDTLQIWISPTNECSCDQNFKAIIMHKLK